MPDDAGYDAPRPAWAGVALDASASLMRHSPVQATPRPAAQQADVARGKAMLTELSRREAEECSRYRFDQDGKAKERTRSFTAADARLIKAQVGSGKSHTAINEVDDALVDDPTLRIAYAVSTGDLQSQSVDKLQGATAREWMPYVGFEREVDGVPICRFPDQAKAARKVGQDPYTTLCDGCPHQDDCPIWEQYTSRANLWVVTHAQLRHGLKPLDEREGFDVVIIDEDPTSTLLPAQRHRTSCLLDGPKQGTKPHAVCEKVYRAISRALSGGGRLRAEDLPSPKELLRAAERLSKTKVTITRDTKPDEAAVAGAEKRLQAAALLRDLIDAMAMGPGPDGQVGGCMVGTDQHSAIVVDIAVPRDIHPQFANATDVQVLSATAEPLLLQRSIPNIELSETPWQPHENGKFVYLQGAPNTLTKLVKGSKLNAGGQQALEAIKTLAGLHDRLLVVAQQPVETALKTAGLPRNVATGHFNALEGLNDYARYDAALILGRPLPKDADLILQAEAAAGGFIDVPLTKPADKNEDKEMDTFGERVELDHTAKDGSTYTTVDHRHADPHLEAVRRVTTYAAVAQSDRLRGQHRGPDNPATIYDATGVNNDWQIDTVKDWRELCGWYSEMAGWGFVPHPAARSGINDLLSALMPHRFKTATVAESHRKIAKRDHGITLATLIEQCTFKGGVVVDIKLPGARYGVPVIVNANTAREAEDVLRKHPNLPEGTKISTKARHTMRLNQPPKEENDHDEPPITYELDAQPRELAAAKKAAGEVDAAGEC